MTKRRTHSSIDRLPASLRETLTRMLVDNEWPADYPGVRDGTPTYEDLVSYCVCQGHSVSLSAIGRFGMRMRTLARMKNAGVIVRDVMKDLTAEKASATQKAVSEIITAQIIEFASEEKLTAKEIQNIARAVKDCTQVSINADKYIREQISEKVTAAAASTKKKLSKAGVNRKLIQEIIDEHLGVVKS